MFGTYFTLTLEKNTRTIELNGAANAAYNRVSESEDNLKGHTEFSAVSKINWHNTKNVTGSSLYSENLVGP
jgi:hypothetical protein